MNAAPTAIAAAAPAPAPAPEAAAAPPKRKLVILCIHGFRQNALQFKGRLSGLQKKLADVATLVFIDAPHVLPLWYKPALDEQERQQQQQCPPQLPQGKVNQQQPEPSLHKQDVRPHCKGLQRQPLGLPAPKRAWLLSTELLAAQPQLQAIFQREQQTSCSPHQSAAPRGLHTMIPPPMAAVVASPVWRAAPADVVTPEQHTMQCQGWQESCKTLQQALTSTDPQIDGLLGFSQGSAVAAVLAALLQQQQQQCTVRLTPAPSTVKFIIVASGFISPAPEHQQLLKEQQPLRLPSLHVYAAASSGSDRQIQQQLSNDLYGLFEPATRQCILHDAGHLIPCRREVVNQIREFLQQFT